MTMSEEKKRDWKKYYNPEVHTRAQAKYDANKTRRYGLKLNLITDADIITQLDTVESIQGYIKQLIREDMTRQRRGE